MDPAAYHLVIASWALAAGLQAVVLAQLEEAVRALEARVRCANAR
jgi:hypothetical protein